MTKDDPTLTDDPPAPGERMMRARSLPDLLTKLFRDIADLLLKESDLIRSEMRDKVTQLQQGVGKVAAGGVVMLVALIVFADALVLAVAELLGSVDPGATNTGWAALIVGGVFAAIGAFLIRSGVTDLKVDNLAPDRTGLQLRRDTEMAKEQVR
jgi:hypothetical protein